MNIYLESFGIFFKIGAFTIGGGYAMVPLIENEIVTKRKWIAQEDFVDLLAHLTIGTGYSGRKYFYIHRIQIKRNTGKYNNSIRHHTTLIHHYSGHCLILS